MTLYNRVYANPINEMLTGEVVVSGHFQTCYHHYLIN